MNKLTASLSLALAGALGACDGMPPGEDPSGDVEVQRLEQKQAPIDSDVTKDRIGTAETVSLTPIDLTTANGFFHNFGANGRTCGTCHDERTGWTITPALAQSLRPDDPLFRFDGSDCLPTAVPNPNPSATSTEVLRYGNIRVEIPIAANADFELASYSDPHACPTPPGAPDLRMYRRPLPSANSAFLATVMWDGRETRHPTIFADLLAQANGATTGHAEAAAELSDADQNQIVNFELGTFHAQRSIARLDLTRAGGRGGPEFLLREVLPRFFIGINDPFLPGFTSRVFTIYEKWEPGCKPAAPGLLAAQIGRGEKIFNETVINITNVAGLNGPHDASQAPIKGFCGTCHDNPNVGNHSVSLPIDIGIAVPQPAGGLDVGHLPLYTFRERATGQMVTLTDPGRGLISGRFADLGKFKGPNLRGLAARAPYFHNGSAKDLAQVVRFYDERFSIGFTEQQKADLVAFLNAL